MQTADYYINTLNLSPHPEGGFYKETYRCSETILQNALPSRFSGDRHLSTGIYYLLQNEDISVFHKIKSDEMWHFYDGSTLLIHVLNDDGTYRQIKLGRQLQLGQQLQAVVPANAWFACELAEQNSFCLAGCTVSPGFDFNDFEIADRKTLSDLFPGNETLIRRLTT